MKFTWDKSKNIINQAKHGISFETAKLIFNDPLHLSIQDRYESDEERWQTLGLINGLAIILVAHSVYEENDVETIRIISARRATKQEKVCYEQAH